MIKIGFVYLNDFVDRTPFRGEHTRKADAADCSDSDEKNRRRLPFS